MTHTRVPGHSADTRSNCAARVICVACSRHLGSELQRLGMPPQQAQTTQESLQHFILKLHGLPAFQAAALGKALEAAGMQTVHQATPANGASLIVLGSSEKLESVLAENRRRNSELAVTLEGCRAALVNYLRTEYRVRYPGGELDLRRKTAVMGVVNVTPDSFSDGGDFHSAESAAEHALRLVDTGADIIDIGGESTRPGSDPVRAEEEMQRVLPVIRDVTRATSVPISIDTYKPEVARAALEAGAKIVNDVSGLRENAGMAELIAEREVPVILMHMKGSPKTMQTNPTYNDLISQICSVLSDSVDAALTAGTARDRIIVDPGIGFGKTFEDNLVILDRLHEIRSLGAPICIGVSRKAFIGAALGIAEPKERLFGSIAANVIAVREGARIVRVHDVAETVEAVRIADAVAAGRLPSET
jgi:dihydropteroate synthase